MKGAQGAPGRTETLDPRHYSRECSAADGYKYFLRIHLCSHADFHCFRLDKTHVLRRLQVSGPLSPLGDEDAHSPSGSPPSG